MLNNNNNNSCRPQLLETRRAGRRRRGGWAAAGPQRPANSGGAYCVATRTACLAWRSMILFHTIRSAAYAP